MGKLQGPRMVGNSGGMTAEEEERIWNLHVTHKLPGKTIAARVGMSQSIVNVFLKKRRDANGVEVKIDRFRIARPL